MCYLEVDINLLNSKTSSSMKPISEDLKNCFEIKYERGLYDLKKRVCLRLLMSRREAGCIIGKSGETISQFRKQSGAKIKISDKGIKEKVVSICGSVIEVIATCQLFCHEFEWNLEIHQVIDSSYFEHLSKVTKFVFRILLPTSLCGPLIGKAGATLQAIRKISGCTIKMTKNKLPNSTDRVLLVFGTSSAVLICLELICAISSDIQLKSPEIPYAPDQERLPDEIHNITSDNILTASYATLRFPSLPMTLLEEVAPNPGTVIQTGDYERKQQRVGLVWRDKPLENDSKDFVKTFEEFGKVCAKDTLDRLRLKSLYPAFPLLDYSIFPASLLMQLIPPIPFPPIFHSTLGALTLSELIRGLNLPSTPQVTPAVPIPFPEQLHQQQQQPSFGHTFPNDYEVQQEMVIENDLIGCVIGRGGMKINDIRRTSKATVIISNLKEYSTSRVITITGSKNSVETAMNMIKISLLGRENYTQQTLPPNG